MTRKAARYFSPDVSEVEKQRILTELSNRGALFFKGDDTDPTALSVDEAYGQALAALEANDIYNPAA